MNKQNRQVINKWSFLLLTLTIVITPSSSFAALNAYMRITGETQGEIKGDVIQAGRTPLLFNALTQNENLTSVEIRFWKPDSSGAEVQYYTIELVNAHIVSIIPSSSSADDESLPIPARETVNFTFERIIMTIEDGGITAEANW